MKKLRVKFWVQSSRSKRHEEVLLLAGDWNDLTEEEKGAEVEAWAPDVFPMFHFTEAHVRYGYELLGEVIRTPFELSLVVQSEEILWAHFSAEMPHYQTVYEGPFDAKKLKRLLDLIPAEAIKGQLTIYKEQFGYALKSEIDQDVAFKIWEVLEA